MPERLPLSHPLLLGLLALIATAAPRPAAAFESAILSFEQVTVSGDDSEVLRGTVYYAGADSLALDIHEPIRQQIFVSTTEVVFYYPDRAMALRSPLERGAALPVATLPRSLLSEDLGLADAGYDLVNLRYEGEVAVSTWRPPAGAEGRGGRVELHTDSKGRISRSQSFGPEGRVLVETEFQEYRTVSGRPVPMRIVSRSLDADGEPISEVRITYSSVRIDVELPPEIAGFTIPEGTDVQVLEW